MVKFNGGKDFSLDDITASFVTRFEERLISEGLAKNTIFFYMRNLRAVHNKAVKQECIPYNYQNIFSGVYTGVEITRKRALSKKDIAALKRLELAIESSKIRQTLALARDLFLFSFYSRGMSFVDLAYLKKTILNTKPRTL